MMLTMSPESRKLALDLIKYGYFRGGFGFGPNNFIHLAPVSVRLAIPGYRDRFRRLLKESD